jgi:hypothetical protein
VPRILIVLLLTATLTNSSALAGAEQPTDATASPAIRPRAGAAPT